MSCIRTALLAFARGDCADDVRRVRAPQHRASRTADLRRARGADAQGSVAWRSRAANGPSSSSGRRSHGHGGPPWRRWKVAYADFVTAMMAFFMVMWILGMDQNLKQLDRGLFLESGRLTRRATNGGQSPISSGNSPAARADDAAQADQPPHRRTRISRTPAVNISPSSRKRGSAAIGDRIEIVETDDGLRIELAEGENGQEFFASRRRSMTADDENTGNHRAGACAAAKSDHPRRAYGRRAVRRDSTRTGSCRRIAQTPRGASSRRPVSNPARVVEVRGMADRELRNPAIRSTREIAGSRSSCPSPQPNRAIRASGRPPPPRYQPPSHQVKSERQAFSSFQPSVVAKCRNGGRFSVVGVPYTERTGEIMETLSRDLRYVARSFSAAPDSSSSRCSRSRSASARRRRSSAS